MIKKFFKFVFGDVGLLIVACATTVVSFFLFPFFVSVAKSASTWTIFLVILLGIFAVGLFVSSFLSAAGMLIRTGISKKWALFACSAVVILVDIGILIFALCR